MGYETLYNTIRVLLRNSLTHGNDISSKWFKQHKIVKVKLTHNTVKVSKF